MNGSGISFLTPVQKRETSHFSAAAHCSQDILTHNFIVCKISKTCMLGYVLEYFSARLRHHVRFDEIWLSVEKTFFNLIRSFNGDVAHMMD